MSKKKTPAKKKISSQSSAQKDDYFRSYEFLQNVINSSPNLIFVKDIHGRFTLGNKAVAEIYGTSVDNLIGKRDADFNEHPDEVDWYCHDDQMVIKEHKTIFIAEEKVSSPDGTTRWFETTKKPILTKNGEYQVLGIATDITERKKLFEQLFQAQKMQSLGRLAGGIAHDFNNLLTVILGHVSLLEESSYQPSMIPRAAEGIKNTSLKAAELVSKILGFAREGKNLNIDLEMHHIIQETLSMLSRTIEENITLETNLDALNTHIKGDPVQIQQVLMNIIINARDAMSPEKDGSNGGILKVSTSNSQHGSQEVIHIKIADTGCGMDKQTKSRIFDPFFSTKAPGHGLGLGLSMVYGIIENHNGDIHVDSELGQGTAFELCFKTIQPSKNKVSENLKSTINNSKGKILVVDDNIYVLKTTAESLRNLGHQVLIASSVQEALACLHQECRDIDVLILDIVMPLLNTEDFIHSIHLLNKDIKIILTTGYDLQKNIAHYREQGVNVFLQKPYDKQNLAKAVQDALTH